MTADDANSYREEILRLLPVSPHRFFELVTSNVPELLRHGYSPQKSEDTFSVWFWKELEEGVRFAVEFDFLLNVNPQSFNIIVLRRRQSAPVNQAKAYAPIIFDLRNLASLLYSKELFPPRQYDWQFRDEITLLEQIADAEKAIIKYGLPWIEDPRSNVAKLRKLMQKERQAKGAA